MATYLKHKPTGDIYIATTYLMERGDMVEIDDPNAPVKKPKAKAKPQAKAKPDTTAEDIEEAMAKALADSEGE